MLNSIRRDKHRRLTFKKFSIKQIQHKAILQNNAVPYFIKDLVMHKSLRISGTSRITRIRNRCISTARGRAIFRFCKLSRIRLREYGSQGLLAGISKASW